MISDFASGILAGLAVAMPIGAVGSYLVGLGARERISVAAAAALGVASVDGCYAVVAAIGGAGLQALANEASDWLEWVATVVLAAVAVHTLLVALRRYRSIGGSIGRPGMLSPARLLSLVALTALNPATLITFAAVVIGRSQSEGAAAWPAVVLFAVGALLASAAWQLLLTGSGNLLGRVLSGRRGQLGISVCSALIMLGLAAGLLLS
jgi:arginine exporter protein ArgO